MLPRRQSGVDRLKQVRFGLMNRSPQRCLAHSQHTVMRQQQLGNVVPTRMLRPMGNTVPSAMGNEGPSRIDVNPSASPIC